MAAAVYSGVDVIARLVGSQTVLDNVYRLLEPDASPNIDGRDRFPVQSALAGASASSRESLLSTSCAAVVRCSIRAEEVTVPWAATVLATLPGVTHLYINEDLREVVLDVVAPDKRTFDDTIMSTIQGQWSVVRSTRTFLVIDGMQWHRAPPVAPFPIFISTAASDLHIALWLSDRIHSDTGLACWTYKDIPVGAPSWTQCIDQTIATAPLHIFLLSEASLSSAECQREFGRAEATSDSRDICCLLLPGCDFDALDVRYRQRQCVSATDMFAYPVLLDWLRRRLRPEPDIPA